MSKIILIVDNVRSTHNVGSLLRTCDGLGVEHVYLCGITPYPILNNGESRLPHIRNRIHKDIHKTALGAEDSVDWTYSEDSKHTIDILKKDGWFIAALEQSDKSIPLDMFNAHQKTALIVGTEVTGLPKNILNICDQIIEIPMKGQKESLNVSVAAAIALYKLTR